MYICILIFSLFHVISVQESAPPLTGTTATATVIAAAAIAAAEVFVIKDEKELRRSTVVYELSAETHVRSTHTQISSRFLPSVIVCSVVSTILLSYGSIFFEKKNNEFYVRFR